MHVLITGGAGFIGSHIAEFHLQRGDSVMVLDDLSTGSLNNIQPFLSSPKFQWQHINLLECQDLKHTLHHCDRVYHCAAMVGKFHVLKHPIEVLNVNIQGCIQILQACKQVKKPPQLMVTSSSSVYGHQFHQPQTEEDELVIKSVAHSHWGYAISKLTNEIYAQTYFRQHQLPVLILRLFNHIGPRQTGTYGMVVPRLIRQALQQQPLTVFGDGLQTRSFMDVRDSVHMFDALFNQPLAYGQIINVGSEHEISIMDLAFMIQSLTHSASTITTVPLNEAYGQWIDETPRRQPDLKKLKSLIKYQPHWTLEATLNNLIQFEKDTHVAP